MTEESKHGRENLQGDGRVSGVYQFVNKVYQAQLYNYGLRTMLDFMVPEPAATAIWRRVRHDLAAKTGAAMVVGSHA